MGADLIAVSLVIDKDKKPDWDAAEKYLRDFSDAELIERLGFLAEHWGVEDMLPEADSEHFAEDVEEYRDWLLARVAETQSAYEDGWRNTTHQYVRDTLVWTLADMSWGDPPEGYDSVCIFIDSGAAKAAGFDG